MAKSITLTVNVDDTQFKAFQKNFNDLEQKMQSLTTKWNNVSNAINKTNKQTVEWGTVLKNVSDWTTGLIPKLARVTEHFGKWAALIGGVTMMLGTGAGIFGIDRLANALIARRRQIMGLGGDWGRIQSAQIATSATVRDPMSTMQRIFLGAHGDQPIRRGLLAAGISPQDLANKSPAEIYEQIIHNMPTIIGRAKKGFEVPYLEQRGLTRIMPIEDWQNFIKQGGGLNVREWERVERSIQERKSRGLTPEEGEKWADLYQAAKGFVADIQTKLGSALSGIATSMAGVSKGFSDLLIALLDSPAVKKALEQVKTWLDEFATYLKSDEAKKKLEEWTKEMEKIPWASLAQTIAAFISELGTVLRVLLALKGATTFGGWGAGIGGAIGSLFGPGGTAIGMGIGGTLGTIGGGALGWFAPDLLRQYMMGRNTPPQPWTFGGAGGVGGAGGAGGPGYWDPMSGLYMPGRPPTFPVNPQNPNATTPPAATNQQGSLGGGTAFASAGGGKAVAMAGGGSSNRMANLASWQMATRNNVPTNVGGGWSSVMASNAMNFNAGNRMGRGRGGPLDVDNWQMNRTAQLRIDNVAGANIYAHGVSMSG